MAPRVWRPRFSLLGKGVAVAFAQDQVARPLLGITVDRNRSGSTHHLFGPIPHHDSSCKLPTVSGSAPGLSRWGGRALTQRRGGFHHGMTRAALHTNRFRILVRLQDPEQTHRQLACDHHSSWPPGDDTGGPSLLPSPPAKRTFHVLSQPDISCATDSWATHTCNYHLLGLPCSRPSLWCLAFGFRGKAWHINNAVVG